MYPQNVSLNPNWTLRAGRELRTLPKSGLVFTPAGFGMKLVFGSLKLTKLKALKA